MSAPESGDVLEPELLLAAYCQGIFPMADDSGRIGWYDPDPRGIIPLETFRAPRRLMKTVRSGRFDLRIDSAFQEVMEACAEAGPGRESTWISPGLVQSYVSLHRLGFAHSVEAWQGNSLVGGLYGVAIRGLFAGESMFSRVTDASKVALVHLVERLRAGGFTLLDTQFVTPHLARFGAVEVSRAKYKKLLAMAMQVRAGL